MAEVTGLSRALVSSTTKDLRKRGLVDSTLEAEDGRLRSLTLTSEGNGLIALAYAEQNPREREWAATLTDSEREGLLRLLRKLMLNGPQ